MSASLRAAGLGDSGDGSPVTSAARRSDPGFRTAIGPRDPRPASLQLRRQTARSREPSEGHGRQVRAQWVLPAAAALLLLRKVCLHSLACSSAPVHSSVRDKEAAFVQLARDLHL